MSFFLGWGGGLPNRYGAHLCSSLQAVAQVEHLIKGNENSVCSIHSMSQRWPTHFGKGKGHSSTTLKSRDRTLQPMPNGRFLWTVTPQWKQTRIKITSFKETFTLRQISWRKPRFFSRRKRRDSTTNGQTVNALKFPCNPRSLTRCVPPMGRISLRRCWGKSIGSSQKLWPECDLNQILQ